MEGNFLLFHRASSCSLRILSLCPFATYMLHNDGERTKMKKLSKGKSAAFF